MARASADLLGFDRYVGPLVAELCDDNTETPFTIGIFFMWGSGKYTALLMVEELLPEEFPDQLVCVRFNPWVHRREPNMLVPLLDALHDSLLRDRLPGSGNRRT